MPTTERPVALDVWAELATATSTIRVGINRALVQRAGMTLAENLVLCHVAMAPGAALRMAEIADLLGIAKSAVTKTVDRLEERGWLQRCRDDADRRAVHAKVTRSGMAAFRRSQPVFAGAVSTAVADRLTAAELQELRRLLGKLRPTSAPA